MKAPFVLNWDIYEYDIVDFGGSVQYTGNVVEKRIDSVMEDDNDSNRESQNSRRFMQAFASACKDHDLYLEMQFTRRIKQYGTALTQIICGFMMLYFHLI